MLCGRGKFIANVCAMFVCTSLPLMIFSQSPTAPFLPTFLFRNRAKGNDFFKEIRLKIPFPLSLSLGSVKARGRRNKSAKPWLKSMPRGRLARIERGEADGSEREEKGRKETGWRENVRGVGKTARVGKGRKGKEIREDGGRCGRGEEGDEREKDGDSAFGSSWILEGGPPR